MQKILEPALLSAGKRIKCIAAVALMSSACGESTPDGSPDAPAPTHERQLVIELPATKHRDLDLLFVIDNSPSMLDKQTTLINNFPRFISALDALPGGLPNLHIGVITTDMGTTASESSTPAPAIGSIGNGGCSGTGQDGALQIGTASLSEINGPFLVDVVQEGGTRTRNYTGDLATIFGKMARVGAGGCGFEQPLAALRAALDHHPANRGFLRAQALLGVVFLSDEDDCSARSPKLFDANTTELGPLQSFRCTRFGVTCEGGGQTAAAMNQVGAKSGCRPNTSSEYVDDVAPYRDFLVGLKSGVQRVAVGGIVGDPRPFAVETRPPPTGGAAIPALAHSCSYRGAQGIEVADPASRLQSFLEGFPLSTHTTICDQYIDDGMQMLVPAFRQAFEGSCVMDRLADIEPSTPSLQADCIVEDVLGATATPIEACDTNPSARPCWQLQSESTSCKFSPPPHLELVVQRTAPLHPAAVTQMRCLVER